MSFPSYYSVVPISYVENPVIVNDNLAVGYKWYQSCPSSEVDVMAASPCFYPVSLPPIYYPVEYKPPEPPPTDFSISYASELSAYNLFDTSSERDLVEKVVEVQKELVVDDVEAETQLFDKSAERNFTSVDNTSHGNSPVVTFNPYSSPSHLLHDASSDKRNQWEHKLTQMIAIIEKMQDELIDKSKLVVEAVNAEHQALDKSPSRELTAKSQAPSSITGNVFVKGSGDACDEDEGFSLFTEAEESVKEVESDGGEENTTGYEPWNKEWNWDDESDVEIETEDDDHVNCIEDASAKNNSGLQIRDSDSSFVGVNCKEDEAETLVAKEMPPMYFPKMRKVVEAFTGNVTEKNVLIYDSAGDALGTFAYIVEDNSYEVVFMPGDSPSRGKNLDTGKFFIQELKRQNKNDNGGHSIEIMRRLGTDYDGVCKILYPIAQTTIEFDSVFEVFDFYMTNFKTRFEKFNISAFKDSTKPTGWGRIVFSPNYTTIAAKKEHVFSTDSGKCPSVLIQSEVSCNPPALRMSLQHIFLEVNDSLCQLSFKPARVVRVYIHISLADMNKYCRARQIVKVGMRDIKFLNLAGKECPGCRGDVVDFNVTPIYGSANSSHVSDSGSGVCIPYRLRAYRVESIRQQMSKSVTHVPVVEALRQIRMGIGATTEQHRRHNQAAADQRRQRNFGSTTVVTDLQPLWEVAKIGGIRYDNALSHQLTEQGLDTESWLGHIYVTLFRTTEIEGNRHDDPTSEQLRPQNLDKCVHMWGLLHCYELCILCNKKGESGCLLEDVSHSTDYIPDLRTFPSLLRFSPAYSVVKQYFVDVDDTVPQKIFVYVIGGDGTQRGAAVIYEEIRWRGLKVTVAGIPKIIDNDIPVIDKSFGFDTAVAESTENGICVVKLMSPSTLVVKKMVSGWYWSAITLMFDPGGYDCYKVFFQMLYP